MLPYGPKLIICLAICITMLYSCHREVIPVIKDATVSARIDEDVKNQAESILRQLGIPVSVVINTLYHQIIIQQGIPFPMKLIKTPATIESMTRNQMDSMLQHSYEQAVARQGRSLDDVFSDLERKHV